MSVSIWMAIEVFFEELGVRDARAVEDRALCREDFMLRLSEVGILAKADERYVVWFQLLVEA